MKAVEVDFPRRDLRPGPSTLGTLVGNRVVEEVPIVDLESVERVT